ncbi:acyl- dehydrogenase [Fusarium langsethiae]|uniref:Acyl-dehydrogenase n=1 Tax=Fusarium langsethiae TaxID=179993 RepID=A0A0M9EZP6_FUSLA|nr:acyl- dehydrogenase [Fusarium langsethiae]GKU04138.1 unnamed protein product [Fusarium langsethiae]
MSASGQQKRKRNADDETLEELNRYANKPLSPKSESIYSKLVDLADRYNDTGPDETLRAFTKYFVAKQEQTVHDNAAYQKLTDKTAKLESDDKEMKANLKSTQTKLEVTEAKLKKADHRLAELEFMFQYGDWLNEVLKHVKSKEVPIQNAQTKILTDEANNKSKAELIALKATVVIPTPKQLEDHRAKAKAATASAKQLAKWSCLKPTITFALGMIEDEIDAVQQWRQNGMNEASAPGTPYLDRIAQASEKAELGHFWKKVTLDGKEVNVSVSNDDLCHTCVDWMKMKTTIQEHKAKIQVCFNNKMISKDTRDCFVALVDQYWGYFCSGEDADGKLILTQQAKDAAAEFMHKSELTVPPEDFFKEYTEGIALPESLGGSDLGITEATMMMQTIAESGDGMAGAQSIHANVYATQPLAKFGTKEQLETTILKVVSGDFSVYFDVTEPNAGLDTLRLGTTAKQNSDGSYSITGQKTWITCGQVASKMILLARTTPLHQAKKPSEGLSFFIIDLDRNQPGLEMRKIKKMGGRAVDVNEVFFDNYNIPPSSLIREQNKGFKMILHGTNAERCLLAGEALDLRYVALAKASGYARERVVFKQQTSMNQAIAHPLADAYMKLEGAKLATYHAARLYDQSKTDVSVRQDDTGVAANSAKHMAAEAAFTACERAVLTYGGMGYAMEYDVERWFRECLVPRIAPVSREMILNYISEKVLELPRSY